MNKMDRIEDVPETYDLLLNFGADRLEFKKKFRLPKTDCAASKSKVIL
jgi:hypothetical protein